LAFLLPGERLPFVGDLTNGSLGGQQSPCVAQSQPLNHQNASAGRIRQFFEPAPGRSARDCGPNPEFSRSHPISDAFCSLCQFGNSRGISRIPCCGSIDLDYQRSFHSSMVKLAPGRWSLGRAVIAGILAWLLAFQGFAFAASSHGRYAPIGAEAGHVISVGGDFCGSPGGGDPHAPGQYHHCQCCIVCSSNHACGLAWLVAMPLTGAIFSPPRTTGALAWRLPGSENKPPSGWTSSWSQRAPPRFS